jgi:iron complex transport system substrate-binding protein
MRIVSLLPSATEVICELGFEDLIVGRSHECDQPESIKDLPALTRSSVKNSGNSTEIDQNIKSLLKNGLSVFSVKVDLLAEIEPDIIFTQDHCEVCAVPLDDVKTAVKEYCGKGTEVVSLSPTNLEDIYQTIHTIGQSLDAENEANRLVGDLQLRMDIIRNTVIGEPVKRVACLEWIDPLMTGGNWIPELLEIVGAEYLLSEPGQHSPWVDWEKVVDENPDAILVVPCGYNIDQTMNEMHLLTQKDGWNSIKAVQNNEVYILDGNRYFNRPGPTIFESTRILGEILHPSLFKPIHQKKGWIHFDEQLQTA